MPWRTKFWIPLKRVDGVFRWSDDTELAKDDYQPWAEGYPKEEAGDCVYMTLHNGESLRWFNTDCNTDLDYACQVDPCDTDHYCNGQDI
ncbi:hypothetical protein OESDEN_07845 [Oesophagostomum dentatum]|uniref:C-type lectin domain-containing protein n=1 Tax=Oesophagostomum dentatum TaxID=61180 RepID=A0A0B1T3Y7_OESDE|nr:hypothetical protein OESDEN_07845 [Oesophagostomum dentatum]